MKTRTAGLAAITAKEFAQWIAPFESTVTAATVRHRHQHQHRQGSLSPTDIEESFRQQQREDGNKNAIIRNVGIAVSGGVDSMALATLLARHYSLQGSSTRLHALIVDHKLRDNSTEEANYVAQQVQKLNVVPHVLTLDWSISDRLELDHHSSNFSNQDNQLSEKYQIPDKTHLETKARLKRYKAIAQQCYDLSIEDVFVGHHAGDQVETTLFRFSRASGIDGLAGIQSIAPLGVLAVPEALDMRVIRPLLQVSKDRLRATCEEAGTQWVEDPSNKSLDYQRNVIRQYQQHQDCLLGMAKVPQGSGVHPLSTTAILAFRDRMNQHRQAAWKQVTPWIKDIWFDNANGACHFAIGHSSNSTPEGLVQENASMGWLQESQNHVSTRLLSFLVRWVNCKDHNPRLEDIQSLQQHLRFQQRRDLIPRIGQASNSPSANVAKYRTESISTSTSPTIYRKLKQRVSKRASSAQDSRLSYQQQQEQLECLNSSGAPPVLARMPITVAGVIFSPPRKSKGVPEHWTISRQPMSHADQVSATVSVPLKEGLDILWDQRFFLRILKPKESLSLSAPTVPSEQVQIRPLTMRDVETIKGGVQLNHQLQGASGLKKLDQWMSTVPGKARCTIPIILSQSVAQQADGKGVGPTASDILSLPTLGLYFGPTGYCFQSRFKSNPPTDAKNICRFRPNHHLTDPK